jgi:hypothetical protein
MGGFTMLGDADAAACEGDACLIPGSRPADVGSSETSSLERAPRD